MILNAQHLCQTRLCIAADCPNDAEPSGYCTRCERKRRAGVEVPLHRVQQPKAPDPLVELWCPGCMTWKPDDAYPLGRGRNTGPNRRDRHRECRACQAARRARNRANQPPLERCAALTKWPNHRAVESAPQRPCRSYPAKGSPYCPQHQPKEPA